jgi:hypothetical protein
LRPQTKMNPAMAAVRTSRMEAPNHSVEDIWE